MRNAERALRQLAAYPLALAREAAGHRVELIHCPAPIAPVRSKLPLVLTLHDLLDVIVRGIDDEALRGPVNAVAPEPARQGEIARALGRVLSRPAFVPAPAFALRTLLGAEMADAVLLASQRLTPRVLLERGHAFRDPQLEPALAALLGKVAGERS